LGFIGIRKEQQDSNRRNAQESLTKYTFFPQLEYPVFCRDKATPPLRQGSDLQNISNTEKMYILLKSIQTQKESISTLEIWQSGVFYWIGLQLKDSIITTIVISYSRAYRQTRVILLFNLTPQKNIRG
jgi:hypothetical protein